ncbi:MAG: hypothetical protein WBA44_06070 [Mesorhizobium sp.]
MQSFVANAAIVRQVRLIARTMRGKSTGRTTDMGELPVLQVMACAPWTMQRRWGAAQRGREKSSLKKPICSNPVASLRVVYPSKVTALLQCSVIQEAVIDSSLQFELGSA